MSIGLINRGDKPVIMRGPMLPGVVQQFLRDVEWGELDDLEEMDLPGHSPPRARTDIVIWQDTQDNASQKGQRQPKVAPHRDAVQDG